MGYSISWIAVRTEDQEALFGLAGVRATAEEDVCFESPVSGVRLLGGWQLLVAQGCNHRLISEDLLRVLSGRWECVACSIEEHVMVSAVSLWSGGGESWSVSHDAQRGMFDLQARGEVPASLAGLRGASMKEQEAEGGAEADVDVIFDVPLLLAKALTGFKHDEEPECFEDGVPVEFEDVLCRKRRWWKPW